MEEFERLPWNRNTMGFKDGYDVTWVMTIRQNQRHQRWCSLSGAKQDFRPGSRKKVARCLVKRIPHGFPSFICGCLCCFSEGLYLTENDGDEEKSTFVVEKYNIET